MAEDTKVRAIVLSVEETTNTVTCFSEPLESIINVKLPPNYIAKQGQRLTFGDHDYGNDTYVPVPNSELITIEDDPSVRFEDNEVLITTGAAFSVLSAHPTYSKQKAYAGAFGHVNVRNELSEAMDRGVLYKVELSVNVSETNNNDKPIFKVSKVHECLQTEDTESFFRSLFKFEEIEQETSTENLKIVVENNQKEIEVPDFHTNENTESSSRSESLISYNRETLLSLGERSSYVEDVQINRENTTSNENLSPTSIEEPGLSSSSSISLLSCPSNDSSSHNSNASGETSPEIIPQNDGRFEIVQEEIRDDSSVQSDSLSVGYPLTEVSSSGKNDFDSKPKPFSFGRMPTSSTEKAQTTDLVRVNEVHKNDIEYCVIALEYRNGEVIGYETNLLRLMIIVMENTGMTQYGTLRFISEREQNEKIYPKPGTIRLSEPIDSVVVNNDTLIRARVMFSSNQKHGSYNKTVAFSDSYGLVKISESDESLESMTVYNTLIKLYQAKDTLTPVFISVGSLEEDLSETSEEFIESMYSYEDKIYSETQKRGISSARPPQNPERTISNKTKGNHSKPRRVTLPNFYKVLLISNKQDRKFFGMVFTSVGDAILRVRPSMTDTGVMLNLLEWASVRLEAIGEENQETFYVTKCSSFVDTLGCTAKILNEEIVVEGRLTLKPVAKYHDILYYKHGLLGYVQGETDLYMGYQNQDVRVQFSRMAPNSYHKINAKEFREINKDYNKIPDPWERCCWRARRLDVFSQDSPDRSRQDTSSVCSKDIDFLHISSGISQQDSFNTPEKMKYVETRNDRQRPESPRRSLQRQNFYDNSYEESSNDEIQYQQSYHNSNQTANQRSYQYISQPSSQYCSPMPTDFHHPNPEPQHYNNIFVPSEMDTASVTSDFNCSKPAVGMIVSRHKQMMIVYLHDFGRAGILRWKNYDSSFIKLGNMIRCVCKPIVICEETLDAPFEVIKILELINGKNDTVVKDEECQVLLNVNLFSQDVSFNDFTRKSGRFILSSEDFGKVLMEETVESVTGQIVPSARLIEEYRGLPDSDLMVGYCVYKKCLVPPKMIDSTCTGTTDIVEYVWKLVKLVSTLKHYNFNQQDIKTKNLGEKAANLEKEDDISRQKKHAQMQFELDNQNRQGSSIVSSSIGFHQRPQSSRFEQSSSNYDNYATPQGSVYNHHVESSQSYNTANESRLGPHRTPSPSLRSETSQHGYHDSRIPTYRSTPQPMNNLQEKNENLFRLLEVMSKRVSAFTRNPDTRHVMNSMAPGDLELLDAVVEYSEKEIKEWRRSTHH